MISMSAHYCKHDNEPLLSCRNLGGGTRVHVMIPLSKNMISIHVLASISVVESHVRAQSPCLDHLSIIETRHSRLLELVAMKTIYHTIATSSSDWVRFRPDTWYFEMEDGASNLTWTSRSAVAYDR